METDDLQPYPWHDGTVKSTYHSRPSEQIVESKLDVCCFQHHCVVRCDVSMYISYGHEKEGGGGKCNIDSVLMDHVLRENAILQYSIHYS